MPPAVISNKKNGSNSAFSSSPKPPPPAPPAVAQTFLFRLVPSSRAVAATYTVLQQHPDFLAGLANLLRVIYIELPESRRREEDAVRVVEVTALHEAAAALAFETLLHVCEHWDADQDDRLPGIFACPIDYFAGTSGSRLRRLENLAEMEGVRRLSGPIMPGSADELPAEVRFVPIVVFGSTYQATENALFLLGQSLLHAYEKRCLQLRQPNAPRPPPSAYSMASYRMGLGGAHHQQQLPQQAPCDEEALLRSSCPRESVWEPITLSFVSQHFVLPPLPSLVAGLGSSSSDDWCCATIAAASSSSSCSPTSFSSSSSSSTCSLYHSVAGPHHHQQSGLLNDDDLDSECCEYSNNRHAISHHCHHFGDQQGVDGQQQQAEALWCGASRSQSQQFPRRCLKELSGLVQARAASLQACATLPYTVQASKQRRSLLLSAGRGLDEQLASLAGLRREDVLPDGDCLFRALSLALFGKQDAQAVALRQLAADAIEADTFYREDDNNLVFLRYLEDDDDDEQRQPDKYYWQKQPLSLEQYCAAMREPRGRFGGDAEIRALSRALQLRISVYSLSSSSSSTATGLLPPPSPVLFVTTPSDEVWSEREVLLFLAGAHYQLLVPLSQQHPHAMAAVAGA